MIVVLYKLKEKRNIEDIIEMAKDFNVKLIFVPRNKEIEGFENYKSLSEIEEKYKKRFIILETYGENYLHEIEIGDDIIVLGAEDFGVPKEEVEKLKNKIVVKIPMKLPGSYTVSSVFAMVLAELRARKLI